MLRFPALAAAITLALPAQAPLEPIRLLLGSQVVDGDSRLVVGSVANGAARPCAVLTAPWQWTVGGRFVDTVGGEVLTLTPEDLTLATLAATNVWSVERRAAHTSFAVGERQCVFAARRIVLPRGGDGAGLVALDRATGAIAWERPDAPSDTIVVDGDLVVAAGNVAGRPRLAAVALANGARAFDVALENAVVAVVAGAHGIAVIADNAFTVFDRAGPASFLVKERPVALVAGADGWFGASGNTVTSWSRTGQVRWTREIAVGDFEQIGLVALHDGGVALLAHLGMADSGFRIERFGPTGELAWRRDEPGLGVAHSKYWHRVEPHVRDRRLFVSSQGAGGSFLVELDPSNGDRLGRGTFGTK